MNDLLKAAEMALEFVEWLCSDDHSVKPKNNALKTREALRQALAEPANSTTDFVEPKASSQPEQKPVAWFIQYEDSHEFVWSKPDGWQVKQALEIQPLYTAPPKQEYQYEVVAENADGTYTTKRIPKRDSSSWVGLGLEDEEVAIKEALRQALAQPDGVLAEREACAKIVEADGLARGDEGLVLIKAASRIRARGEK